MFRKDEYQFSDVDKTIDPEAVDKTIKKKKKKAKRQDDRTLNERIFAYDSKFARFMNALGDVLLIGLLWLVISIPLFTIGASTTAAYYAMAKCVRYSAGRPWKSFWHSFKTNFLQTLPMTILFDLAVVMLAFDLIYLWGNENATNDAIFIVLLLVVFLAVGLSMYLWPLLSRFDKRNLELMKMSFVVAFRFLPVTIGIMAAFLLGLIGIYLMPWAVLVIPGVFMYGFSFPMEWILHKLMPKPEEGSEEAEKWYYQ